MVVVYYLYGAVPYCTSNDCSSAAPTAAGTGRCALLPGPALRVQWLLSALSSIAVAGITRYWKCLRLPSSPIRHCPVARRFPLKVLPLDHHPRPTLSFQHLSPLFRLLLTGHFNSSKGTYGAILTISHLFSCCYFLPHSLLLPFGSLLGDRQLVSWLGRALLCFSGQHQYSSQQQVDAHDHCVSYAEQWHFSCPGQREYFSTIFDVAFGSQGCFRVFLCARARVRKALVACAQNSSLFSFPAEASYCYHKRHWRAPSVPIPRFLQRDCPCLCSLRISSSSISSLETQR